MADEPSKEEEQRRTEAIFTIFELVVEEARTRGRADIVGALKDVTNDLCARVGALMDIIRRSEREAAEAAGKEVKP